MPATLYFDVNLGQKCNSAGSKDLNRTALPYKSLETWTVYFVANNAGTVTAVDMSSAVTFRGAVKTAFGESVELDVQILNASINSTDKATGKLIVTIDTDSAQFLTDVGSSASKEAYFEVAGLDSNGYERFYAIFPIYLQNKLNPAGGTPPSPVGNYYTKTEADSRYTLSGIADLSNGKTYKIIAQNGIIGLQEV